MTTDLVEKRFFFEDDSWRQMMMLRMMMRMMMMQLVVLQMLHMRRHGTFRRHRRTSLVVTMMIAVGRRRRSLISRHSFLKTSWRSGVGRRENSAVLVGSRETVVIVVDHVGRGVLYRRVEGVMRRRVVMMVIQGR